MKLFKTVTITVVLALLSPFFLRAQDCKNDFYPFKKGVKTEYQNFDRKDRLISISRSEILELKTVGDSLKAVTKVLSLNEKGKEIASGEIITTCVDGLLLMDLRSLMSTDLSKSFQSGELEISGNPLIFPENLKVGDALPDGDMNMTVKSGGMKLMNMTFTVKDRKVESKEKITVKAGEFEAYKITYNMNIDFIFSRDLRVVQYMVAGVGMVKSENYDKNGKLDSYMELVKIQQ